MLTRIKEIISEEKEIKLDRKSFGNLALIKAHKEVFIKEVKDFNLFISEEEYNYTNSIVIYITANELVTLEEIINLSVKIKEMFNKRIDITFGRKIVKDLNYILVEIFLSSEKKE